MPVSDEICQECGGTGLDHNGDDCVFCYGEGVILYNKPESVHKYRDSSYSHDMQKKSSKSQHRLRAKNKQNRKYDAQN